MRKLSWLIIVLIVVGLFLMACRQAPQPTPAPELKTPAVKAATPAPKVGWEQKWEAVLLEAKKEGTVSLYTVWGADIRIGLTEAFKSKYGINLEFLPSGRGEELVARFLTEKRAGLSVASVFGIGNTLLITMLKPEGILRPIEPLLILPEVLDAKAWHGGEIPFFDKEGLSLSFIGLVLPMLVYNTNLIKEGEITSFKDVLKPQYKGKITMDDPSVTGSGSAALRHLANNLWGKVETEAFFRRLVKDQEVDIQRDKRIPVESLARGKYTIGLAPSRHPVREFILAGAPLKIAMIKESNHVTCGSQTLGVPTGFAHPNATTIFVNWLLTKEGQSVYAESAKEPSMRLDASTKGIEPAFIPIPGEKYYPETEETLKAADWVMVTAKKIMEEAGTR